MRSEVAHLHVTPATEFPKGIAPRVVLPVRLTTRRHWVTLLVALLTMAPAPPTPAPETVIGSVLLNFCPLTSSVAPLLIVVLPAAVPNAKGLPALKAPWATMMSPPKTR